MILGTKGKIHDPNTDKRGFGEIKVTGWVYAIGIIGFLAMVIWIMLPWWVKIGVTVVGASVVIFLIT